MVFLLAGIQISKLEYLQDILEENALRLIDIRHMLDLVPFVLKEEKSRIKREISGKFLSFVFDGTSRLGEILAVVIRYIDGWEIQQHLVRLQFLTKSISGEEVARELISILSVMLGVESHLATRDRASMNNAAMPFERANRKIYGLVQQNTLVESMGSSTANDGTVGRY